MRCGLAYSTSRRRDFIAQTTPPRDTEETPRDVQGLVGPTNEAEF